MIFRENHSLTLMREVAEGTMRNYVKEGLDWILGNMFLVIELWITGTLTADCLNYDISNSLENTFQVN